MIEVSKTISTTASPAKVQETARLKQALEAGG